MLAPAIHASQPKVTSDVVLWEAPLGYSRDQSGVVLLTTVTALGTPVTLDSNGKLIPLPNDGSDVCYAVAISYRAATTADTTGDVLLIRRTAMLKDSGILWPAGISGANITKALGELDARGIIVRATA